MIRKSFQGYCCKSGIAIIACKELYAGNPNSDIPKLCTETLGEECKQTQCPHRS